MEKINNMVRGISGGFEDEPTFVDYDGLKPGNEIVNVYATPDYDIGKEEEKMGRSISDLIRENHMQQEEAKVIITAMGASFGSLAISSLERAKTIKRYDKGKGEYVYVDAENEYKQNIMRRLGIKSTTVPDLGETIVSNAVLAVVKMALLNDVDLDTITEVNFATESAGDLTKNLSLEVIDMVNRASDILGKHGINIGHLKERNSSGFDSARKAVHSNQYQNACISAMQEIYACAKDGLSERSRKLIIASDYAEYAEFTSATETGGFGSIAFVVEPATNAKDGILVSSKFLGEANIDSNEFTKKVVLNIGAGMSIINTDPIVQGHHSNYTYLYLFYDALSSAFKTRSNLLWSMSEIMKYSLGMHIPLSEMPYTAVAYYLRHLARNDESLNESLGRQIGMADPMLDLFQDHRNAAEFMHKVVETYVNFEIMRENVRRIRESSLKDIAELLIGRMINSEALKQASAEASAELSALVRKYSPEKSIARAMKESAKNLAIVAKAETVTLETVVGAYKPISDKINEIGKRDLGDEGYNNAVKKTKEFGELAKALQIDEMAELSRVVGNIDSASAPLAMISHIINTDNSKRHLQGGYGSTSNSIVLLMEFRNIKAMADALKTNIEYEDLEGKMGRRRFLTADEYVLIQEERKGMHSVNKKLPISKNNLFGHIEENALVDLAKELIEMKRPRAVSNGYMSDQVVRRMRLLSKQIG